MDKPAVLYHRTTYLTGRKIARAIGAKAIGGRRAKPVQTVGSLIRWGSQMPLSLSTLTIELNGIASLSLSSDKLRALRAISEEHPTGIVPFSVSAETLLEWAKSHSWPSEPIILGRNRHGSRGTDIKIYVPYSILSILKEKYTNVNPRILTYTSSLPPKGSELYTLYVPNIREYRIHVFRDRILRVQGKYLDFPEQHTIPYIKNHAQGYRFRTPDVKLNSDRLELAKSAVSILGLDFGAVDLIIGEDKNAYFLEVNSAPACYPMTLRAYAEAFADVLDLAVDYNYLESLCASQTNT